MIESHGNHPKSIDEYRQHVWHSHISTRTHSLACDTNGIFLPTAEWRFPPAVWKADSGICRGCAGSERRWLQCRSPTRIYGPFSSDTLWFPCSSLECHCAPRRILRYQMINTRFLAQVTISVIAPLRMAVDVLGLAVGGPARVRDTTVDVVDLRRVDFFRRQFSKWRFKGNILSGIYPWLHQPKLTPCQLFWPTSVPCVRPRWYCLRQ